MLVSEISVFKSNQNHAFTKKNNASKFSNEQFGLSNKCGNICGHVKSSAIQTKLLNWSVAKSIIGRNISFYS